MIRLTYTDLLILGRPPTRGIWGRIYSKVFFELAAKRQVYLVAKIPVGLGKPVLIDSTCRIKSIFSEIAFAVDIEKVHPYKWKSFRHFGSQVEEQIHIIRFWQGETLWSRLPPLVVPQQIPVTVEEIEFRAAFLAVNAQQYTVGISIETIELIVHQVFAQEFLCKDSFLHILVWPLTKNGIDVFFH